MLESLSPEQYQRYLQLQQRLTEVEASSDPAMIAIRHKRSRQLPKIYVNKQERERMSKLQRERQEVVLAFMEPLKSYSSRAIADELRKRGVKVQPQFIGRLMNPLVRDGIIIRKMKRMSIYYRPLPQEIDIPVIYLPNSRSACLGWIEAWQPLRGKEDGEIYPIIRLINGQSVFAAEDSIEPVSEALHLKWIEQVKTGKIPQPPFMISPHLIQALDPRKSSKFAGHVASTDILPIAIQLGLVGEGTKAHRLGDNRHKVIAYLDEFYPGWRFGYNPHRFLSSQPHVA